VITGIDKGLRDAKLRTRPDEDEPWRPIALQMQPHGWPGRLVTIDGIDGSGKSTLLRAIARQLEGFGSKVIQTRTPSDDVRNMLLWRAWHDHTLGIPQSEIHEFGLTVISLGDKLLHQRRVIQKHLMAGDWIVSDRYTSLLLRSNRASCTRPSATCTSNPISHSWSMSIPRKRCAACENAVAKWSTLTTREWHAKRGKDSFCLRARTR